jgi:O-antigen/teichoic acid export membrane protein
LTAAEPSYVDVLDMEYQAIESKRAGIIARLLHGTGAGAVSYGLGVISNLLLLPLYLHYWSVSVYGEWVALYSVVNYLNNLDCGITTAATNAATVAFASKNWKDFKRIQGTAWAAALAIAGFGGLVVTALSLTYFHVDQWLGMTSMSHADARLVFFGLAISFLVNIPGRQLITVFIATGNFVKYQWLYNAFSFLTFIAITVGLISGAGPALLAAIVAGATLLTVAISLWLLNQRRSEMFPRLRDAQWNTARTLAAPTGQFGLSMFASVLTIQGPVIVVARMLGGPSVALFTATRTIVNVVRSTVMLPRQPLLPELAAASARPNKDALGKIFRLTVGIDTIIAISLLTILWSGGTWLIQFWSHGRIQPDPLLLQLLLLASILEGFLQVLASTGWATNRIRGVSFAQLASALVSLLLACALVHRFGTSAIPLGAIIPLIAIMTPMALWSASNETHLTFRFVALRLFAPFVVLSFFSVVFPAWIESFNFIPKWLSVFLAPLAVYSVAVFTVAAVSLTRADRQSVSNRVFDWIPKLSARYR